MSIQGATPIKSEQESTGGKGQFYFAWGYNKDWFSRSDIHFYNNGQGNYDFTLHKVKASDRPGFSTLLRSDLSVPQYVYRLGYYINSRHGLEISFDHTKYIVRSEQQVRLRGRINDKYYDRDTLIVDSLLAFEHSDGANFLMLNYIMRKLLVKKDGRALRLDWVLKPGLGTVIPKTKVTLFGETLDNKFHMAGWIVGAETGLRFSPWKYFFSEATVKGSFANYTNVLVIGDGRANHHFWTFEVILNAGFQFPL